MIGINLCEQQPQRCYELNAHAVTSLARICESRGICLVQPSSHAVFDGMKDGFYVEEDIPNPINTYAVSKYVGEIMARNLCSRHYIVRLPTLFGPRRNRALGFVDKMIEQIRGNLPIRVPNDKIDSPTYTMDAARVILQIAAGGRPYGIYHVANQGRVSYYEFIVYLAKALSVDHSITQARDDDFPSLGRKPLKTAMASSRLDALRPWQSALDDYLKNYLSHDNSGVHEARA